MLKLGIIIIIIGYIGYIIFNNLIMMLISLELILLGIATLAIVGAYMMDDTVGVLISLLILPIAGAESALALTILVNYAPKRGKL